MFDGAGQVAATPVGAVLIGTIVPPCGIAIRARRLLAIRICSGAGDSSVRDCQPHISAADRLRRLWFHPAVITDYKLCWAVRCEAGRCCHDAARCEPDTIRMLWAMCAIQHVLISSDYGNTRVTACLRYTLTYLGTHKWATIEV